MKKFLSLVLALVMTMSLVTIGAGATDYKNLTDKDEIQYSEAVAVLNKLGIITGYEDGSFKPTGALTRGAAAKIIVSLMIGPSAASNLTVAAAPYKDVPVTNTFAAVISYCKTAGYISGYTDGTFRPTGALTGYAFSKMLLGALGYSSSVEGFTGSGWTMNVAKIGNVAGLFKDITSFSGNAGVDRQTACQLALNTLKGTEVEYVGNTVSVSGKDMNVVVGNNKYSKVENLKANDYRGSATGDELMQFCEEHFSDLKLTTTTSTSDDFQRPSNSWSYKNVTVGTYAKTPAYVYTKGVGDTKNSENENAVALGLKGFTFKNGSDDFVNAAINGTYVGAAGTDATKDGFKVSSFLELTNLTANGRVVEVYTSDENADQITDIVVIDTFMTKVNSINTSSQTVTLKLVGGKTATGADASTTTYTVKDADNDNYAALAKMAKDDYVMITVAGTTVESIKTPTVVTGKISAVAVKSDAVTPNGVTVSGTAYKLTNTFSSKDQLVKGSVSTTVSSTAYVDTYGYVIYMKDMTASVNYILVKSLYSSMVDGKIVTIANGYAMDGSALSLNIGSNATPVTTAAGADKAAAAEKVVYGYTTKDTKNNAEYVLQDATVTAAKLTKTDADFTLNAGVSVIGTTYFASDVKFVFASLDSSNDITGVTVKDGVQKITTEAQAYYTLNSDGRIDNVIVLNDSDVATGADVLFVNKQLTQTTNAAGKTAYTYEVYKDGAKLDTAILSKDNISNKTFVTYAVDATTNEYTLKAYAPLVSENKTTSVATGVVTARNGSYIQIDGATTVNYNTANAQIIDLTDYNLTTLDEIVAKGLGHVQVSFVYNNGTGSEKGTVSYLFVVSADYTVLTYANANFKVYTDVACAHEVATGTSFVPGTVLYVASTSTAADASELTSANAGFNATAVTPAVDTTSAAVYEYTVQAADATLVCAQA